MTLDEAIIHCEEVAHEKDKEACNLYDVKAYEESRDCIWCSVEHRQLAEWLIELKQYKDASNHPETVTEFADRCRECGAKYGKLLKQEPCEDCISRQAVIDVTWEEPSYTDALNVLTEVRDKVKVLPPVTPKPKVGHCKDCKHFEYDSIAKVNGIPLIVAHEICSRWGDGCKTKEDGYCFLFEPKMLEVQE